MQLNPRQIESGPQILAQGEMFTSEALNTRSCELLRPRSFALATELKTIGCGSALGRGPDRMKVFLSCYLTRR